MNSCLYLLIITFVCIFAHVADAKPQAAKWKCDAEDAKTVDTLVARIMTYGRPDRKFPVNKDELKKYCKEQATLVARLDDYKSQCLKSRSKQIVSVIIYSIKNLATLYCKNPNSKRSKDLINSAVCANQASFDYQTCNDDYVDMLLANLASKDSKDSKKQLAQVCCGYIEIFKCIKRQAVPHKTCSEPLVEANSNYIRGFFDNSIQVMCGDYNDSTDLCSKIKLDRKISKSMKARRPESYFSPLVKVLANL